MKELFIKNSISLITNYNKNYTEEDIEKIKYGLEGLYLTITKLIVIFLISIIFNFFKELLIMLIFFNIIRFPAFGFHADKSITCLIISTTLLLGLTYIMINTPMTITNKALISLICLIGYILFAPADTVKRPLTNAKKRKYRKVASICCATAYIVIILLINEMILSNIILTALIVECIMINPIMYKLFGMPYNNYKNTIKT